MLRRLFVMLLLVALVACTTAPGGTPSPSPSAGGTTSAGTTHSSNITASETWATGVHTVDGQITVAGPNGPVLTIQPGCTIKFTKGSRLIIGSGAPGGLIAQGSASQSIVFTSSQATPAAADWDGIYIQDQANSAQTKLSYCTVEDAGAGTEWLTTNGAGVYVAGANVAPTIDHVTVQKCTGYGFYFADGAKASAFTNNTVTGMSLLPVSVEAGSVDTLGAGNAYTSNGSGIDGNAIEVRGGDVVKDASWSMQPVPYRVQGNVNVGSTNGAVLTLMPGTTLQMGQNTEIIVGQGSNGALMAVGTSAATISFTALPNAPNAGEWAGISFWDQANPSKCQISHCDIAYAGGNTHSGTGAHSAVWTDVNLNISNTRITHSAGFPLFLSGTAAASTTVTGNGLVFQANLSDTVGS